MKKFPEDFIEKDHLVVPDAKQWLLFDEMNEEVLISIVGGGYGLYGNGVTSFEMWDYSQDAPQGWMNKEEINKYLEQFKG